MSCGGKKLSEPIQAERTVDCHTFLRAVNEPNVLCHISRFSKTVKQAGVSSYEKGERAESLMMIQRREQMNNDSCFLPPFVSEQTRTVTIHKDN